MLRLKIAAAGVAAATLGAGLIGASAADASTAVLTNVGFSQTTAVNAGQTNYPVSIHWTNSGAASTIYIYRNQGGDTLIGQANGSVNTWYDVLTLNGNTFAYGTWTSYDLYAYDSNGNYLGEFSTPGFEPYALDDASGQVAFNKGTWYRTGTVTGATKNHYTYSSTAGATATLSYGCWYNIGLVGTTTPTGGTANIVVNNVIIKKVSFKSATVKKRVLLWKTGYPSAQCTSVKLVQTSGQINVDTAQEFVD